MGGGAGIKILIIGTGVFGRLAADEARRRGHEVISASRHHPQRPIDADDAASVRPWLDVDAVMLAAGPFQGMRPAVAQAAQAAGVPYADMADDADFSQQVVALGDGVPLLTGMSTAPAVAEALAAVARRDVRGAHASVAALWTGPGNRQGPATARFAGHAHMSGRPERVVFPNGTRKAWPARGHFAPPGLEARFVVAPGGAAAIGWRLLPVLRPVLPWLTRLPRLSHDTGATLMVEVTGESTARASLHAERDGQRMAVLPAIWALEQAVDGRAPRRGALPREWVDPEALLACLEAAGFSSTSSGDGP